MSDGLYEDPNPSRRHGHGTVRTGPAPRTREGLVPATDREAGPASRPQLRREVDEVRTLAVLLRRPTSHQRTAFLQDRGPPDSTDDERRRHAGDLPNDAPRPHRSVVQTRGRNCRKKSKRRLKRSRPRDLVGLPERLSPPRRCLGTWSRLSHPLLSGNWMQNRLILKRRQSLGRPMNWPTVRS